jgi:catabolite regulation protein CreA
VKGKNMTKRLAIIIVLAFAAIAFTWGICQAGPQAVRIDRFEAIDRLGPNDYDLETLRIDDPDNPFISIYVTHIIGTGIQFSDPSNVSIACRLTGKIPMEDGKQLINTTTNHNVANFSKSIGTKVMRVSRCYDKNKNVLIYRVYTTKLFDGSLKHSMSVVPLGAPLSP